MEKMIKDKNFEKDLKNAENLNKFLKYLKIFIIIILMLSILYFTRNAIILYSIANKYDEFSNYSNYHLQVSYREGDLLNVNEIYYKDGISISQFTQAYLENFSTPKYIQHYDRNSGKITTFENNNFLGNLYYYDNEAIITSMCTPMYIIESPSSFFNSIASDATFWDYITYFVRHCFSSKIESTKLQGNDCYKITYGAIYYVDKKTGNLLRVHDGVDLNYYYEFDTVTDEDVKMPNLSEYTLHEFEN